MSQIRDFYKNQNVLVTGGTGFLGKILIEKLLRSTDVRGVYVLIREKHGVKPQRRLDDIFEKPVFDRLKRERSDFLKRVVLIPGELTCENLKLLERHKANLISSINIVLHLASHRHFTERIQKIYNINVKGTENLLKLCKEMKFLKVFIYVSTAYSHGYRELIEEVIYECPLKHDEVDKILSRMSTEEAAKATPDLLDIWPNTYLFTKALAEELVSEYRDFFPVGVFRPGILASTYKEPIECWTDSYSGVNIILKYAASGLIRLFTASSSYVEAVPADLTVCAIIATAWDVSNQNINSISVYNYISTNDNPVTFHEFLILCYAQIQNYPLEETYWAPNFTVKVDSKWTQILMLVYHFSIAFIIDSYRILSGKEPEMINKMKHINGILRELLVFSNKPLDMSNGNVNRLWAKMDDMDRFYYNFDIKSVQWISYLRKYFKGVRVYLLRDDLSTLPAAQRKLKWLQFLQQLLTLFKYFVLFLFFFGVVTLIRRIL